MNTFKYNEIKFDFINKNESFFRENHDLVYKKQLIVLCNNQILAINQ
jgi:hypothetical protein